MLFPLRLASVVCRCAAVTALCTVSRVRLASAVCSFALATALPFSYFRRVSDFAVSSFVYFTACAVLFVYVFLLLSCICCAVSRLVTARRINRR